MLQMKKTWYLDYFLIAIGTGLMALSVKSVFDEAGLVPGGFSGAAILIKEISQPMFPGGFPLWLTNIALNALIFLAGLKILGFRGLKKALAGELFLSLWLYVQPVFPIASGDLFLTAIYGGVLMGVGIGFVFLGHGTTGGTDFLAAILQRHMRHYSIAQILLVIDGIIVISGAYVFGLRKAMYGIISVFLVTKISDGLIEGLKFSKAAYIISDHFSEISDTLMEELGRGVTGISAKGMFSDEEKMMLFCVVSKKQLIQLKEIAARIDPRAFVIVSDAREVFGEGFIEEPALPPQTAK